MWKHDERVGEHAHLLTSLDVSSQTVFPQVLTRVQHQSYGMAAGLRLASV